MLDIRTSKIAHDLRRVREALNGTRSLGILVEGSHLKAPSLTRQICRRMSYLYLIGLSRLVTRGGDHNKGPVTLTAGMAFVAGGFARGSCHSWRWAGTKRRHFADKSVAKADAR